MATIVSRAQPASRTGVKALIRRHPLVAYFSLAFALMWMFALPMAFSRDMGVGLLSYEIPASLETLLYFLTTFSGPTVAALIVTGVIDGRGGIKRLLKRIVQWRVGVSWYIVALVANLLIWLLAYTALLGLDLPRAAATHWSLLFTIFLPFVAFGMIIPSIAEEPGWRGFALPRLQSRFGPLGASLILGLLHGLWHLPALMTAMFGPLPLANYVPFMLTAMMGTVLYTWVYNHTCGSILIAMLLHASGNAAAGWLTELIKTSGLQVPQTGVAGWLASTGWINVIAFGLAALLFVVFTRGRLGEPRR